MRLVYFAFVMLNLNEIYVCNADRSDLASTRFRDVIVSRCARLSPLLSPLILLFHVSFLCEVSNFFFVYFSVFNRLHSLFIDILLLEI